ncbi:MAG: ketol-acid reductoisomerase, partial [Erysipelotrichia bacterium]|nr:ketol-acid reductoisomerase [Erysipelotrichia bacterium]
CYLFDNACRPLLKNFMNTIKSDVIGKGLDLKTTAVPNRELVATNDEIRNHEVETIGRTLRAYMTAMKPIM